MELKPVSSIAVKPKTKDNLYRKLKSNVIKLVYIAESLSFLDNIFNSLNISLIAIDEAHCISSWDMIFGQLTQILDI
jgi:superfamily II DNA helicase RecQ